MKIITIHTAYIQLDQFLKWANITTNGGDIRFFIEEKRILVNNEICLVKRKKLYHGDIVTIKNLGSWKVLRSEI